jgi:membrane-associated PAP2 superfamily phosphatase
LNLPRRDSDLDATAPSFWAREAAALRLTVRDAPILSAVLATVIISGVFMAFPALDLAVSELFYVKGRGFPLEINPFWSLVRDVGQYATTSALIAVIALLVAKIVLPARPMVIPPRVLLFLASTQILGPGLLVNGILKEYWGRARPRQTDLFGGRNPFSSPWEIADGCQNNCSFVSGEASSSFWLIAFVFVVPERWRVKVLAITLIIASILSALRVAFGGHYLSDVLIAWGLTLIVILVMRHALLIRPGPGFDPAVENGLATFGRALAAPFQRLGARRS